MRRENEKLIIDGNAIYELDLECVRKKQENRKEMAGVWSSQKKEGSPQTIPGIKDNLQERVSTQSVVEKETRKRKNAFRICLKKGTGENSRCPDFLKRTEKTALFHMWETQISSRSHSPIHRREAEG